MGIDTKLRINSNKYDVSDIKKIMETYTDKI